MVITIEPGRLGEPCENKEKFQNLKGGRLRERPQKELQLLYLKMTFVHGVKETTTQTPINYRKFLARQFLTDNF